MKHDLNNAGIKCLVAVVTGLAFMAQNARSIEVETKTENTTLNIGGTLQTLGVIEKIEDPYKDSERLLLFLKQARLETFGKVQNVDYEVELMFGGEEVPERNSVMSLLDGYLNVPFVEDTFEVKVGQFKVPYGRERLFDSDRFFTTDRSIQNQYFNIGRDVGGAVHGKSGLFTGAAGVFTGGGINIPQRYIPEDLDAPMFVSRLGINNGLDKDIFTPYDFETKKDKVTWAAYLNGMYTGDSRVGHSTPLNVKYYDKSVMLLDTWNPYIGEYDQKADFWQFGPDFGVEIPLSKSTSLLLSAEANVSSFENDFGSLENIGGVTSANLIFDDWILGLRYAYVDPDPDMAYTEENEETGEIDSYQITDQAIHEITGSVVYFWRDYNLKLIGDLSYQMNVPLSVETGHGVYNLLSMPEQITYASNGGINIEDGITAKVILQFQF
jgi:hypothetical protein